MKRRVVLLALMCTSFSAPSFAKSRGDVFVANIRSSAVSRYDGETGAFKGIFVEAGSGLLKNPTGIAFGPDGNLYVSSSANNRILRYVGATGKFLDVFIESNALQKPFSLIFGPDRNLYVSSGTGAKVLRFDGKTGRFLNVAATGAGLNQPIGLAFGPDKKLHVINSVGKNVMRFDPSSGTFLGIFAKDNLAFPSDLVFVKDKLYVSNAANGTIAIFDGRTGEYRGVLATLPDRGVPMGLARDGAGRLWVGDFSKGRLFRVNINSGEVQLVASEGMSGPENIAVRKRR